MFAAPASSEFSTSSFTAEWTLVTTCELERNRTVSAFSRFILYVLFSIAIGGKQARTIWRTASIMQHRSRRYISTSEGRNASSLYEHFLYRCLCLGVLCVLAKWRTSEERKTIAGSQLLPSPSRGDLRGRKEETLCLQALLGGDEEKDRGWQK